MRLRFAWRVSLASLLLGLGPTAASAQQATQSQQPAFPSALPQRAANYAWDGELLRASFSYRDVLSDPALTKKLSSGLPTKIVMRAYVYEDGLSTPVALATRVCSVVDDLVDDVYRVHIVEPERVRDQAVVLDGVFRLCTEARDLAVVRRELLAAGQSYFLGVIVDVNPMSEDVVAQTNQWLSRRAGSTAIGPADALFGSFAQLFAHRLNTSDKTLTFRTQSFRP